MDKAYFDRLNAYCLIMIQADKMLSCGIISEEEYAIIDTKAADISGISSCSIYRRNPLMYKSFPEQSGSCIPVCYMDLPQTYNLNKVLLNIEWSENGLFSLK